MGAISSNLSQHQLCGMFDSSKALSLDEATVTPLATQERVICECVSAKAC